MVKPFDYTSYSPQLTRSRKNTFKLTSISYFLSFSTHSPFTINFCILWYLRASSGCPLRFLFQFFDFTKLFSSLQTQVISFLAFKFSPIIEAYTVGLRRQYTIYGHSKEKGRVINHSAFIIWYSISPSLLISSYMLSFLYLLAIQICHNWDCLWNV